jgi:hypothetical protein
MSTEERMSLDERRKYLRIMQKRYRLENRTGKSRLLDEMEQVTGHHRKYLIELMAGNLERKRRPKQRGRSYGPEVDDAVRVISESLDHICAERLTPNLVWMARHLAAHGELELSPALLEQLDRISVSTVQRILSRIRQDQPRLPRKGPRRANRVTRGVPMERIAWDEQEPGHFEVDIVHHSGPNVSGEFVCTLQMIDVATGWSERRAVLGRSALVMEDAFRCILRRLPFPVLEIHPDNGSEFFNDIMVRFWKDVVKGVRLSRSRPYRKNDNRFVEQKNSTLVRRFLGNERLDTVRQTIALNDLYDKMWLYYNLFQPVMRLSEKIYVKQEGHTIGIKRRYDEAQTPFDRLCKTGAISPETRAQLETIREAINPLTLRDEIEDLIEELFSLPLAEPGSKQNVHLTLDHYAKTEEETGGYALLFNSLLAVAETL